MIINHTNLRKSLPRAMECGYTTLSPASNPKFVFESQPSLKSLRGRPNGMDIFLSCIPLIKFHSRSWPTRLKITPNSALIKHLIIIKIFMTLCERNAQKKRHRNFDTHACVSVCFAFIRMIRNNAHTFPASNLTAEGLYLKSKLACCHEHCHLMENPAGTA